MHTPPLPLPLRLIDAFGIAQHHASVPGCREQIVALLDHLAVFSVYSTLQYKSYEKGREKWQGVGLEVIWIDEECPTDIYYEALTRTNETGGVIYMTFTPILGTTEIVRMFMAEGERIA